MPDRIIHIRNLTAGTTPTTSSLGIGELAINVADGKIFVRQSGSLGDTIQTAVTTNNITTGSVTISGSLTVTGSLRARDGVTGSLQGTASWAVSASWAPGAAPIDTSSFATTGSNTFKGSQTISGSFAVQNSISTNDLTKQFGQIGGGNNYFEVEADTWFSTIIGTQQTGLQINIPNRTYLLGDRVNNNTQILVNDINQTISLTGSVLLNTVSDIPQSNVVTIDTLTGQLYYTASSAIGGGGVPVDTSAFVTTSSFNAFTESINTATSSFVTNSQTSSFVQNSQTSSFVTTSSFNSFTSSYNTGSFSGSFTGSLFGTATTASYVQNAQTASYVVQAVSASFATTASYAMNAGGTPGGSNTQIQFNSNGAFSGSSNFTFNSGSNTLTLTGSLLLSQSYISQVDYIDFTPGKYDTATANITPLHIEGRLFYDTGSQTLCMYNAETDVTLNIGQESWLRARNQTGVTITNGSVVRISGAIGSRPSVVLAQSIDQTNGFGTTNDIIGMATHDIEQGTDGFITTFGLVNGVNTANFTAGDLLWVSQSAGQYTNVAPSAPFDKSFVGIVTRVNANTGTIFISPNQPIHFHDLSSVSASGNYTQGQLWMYRASGSSGVWTNTTTLSGSYIITGSLNVSAGITGSLEGTASWSTNALTASLAPNYVLNSATSSFVLNAQTSSFATTSSNIFNGNQTITGSLTVVTGSNIELQVTNTGVKIGNISTDAHTITGSLGVSGSTVIIDTVAIGTSSLGPSENTLTLGARDAINEGGQLGFNAPGGTYTSASFFDLYQNRFRLLRGTNAGSTGEVASWNLGNLQAALPAYTSATSFPGTPVASLATDSGGNILTQAIPGYTLAVTSTVGNLISGTTYYFGSFARAILTAADQSRVYIPRTGTIKKAYITQGAASPGATVSISVYIRLNNTTDTLVATSTTTANFRTFINNALAISVTEGDYIEMKITNTSGTAPSSVIFGGTIYIE